MNNSSQLGHVTRVLFIGVLSLFAVQGRALADDTGAKTIHVANKGVDRDGCGTRQAPCRSLSRAIANADPGDLVLVGPGRYGDLDLDGELGEPGEETGQPDFGCQCMVNVDKRVTVRSTHGAIATVVDARVGIGEDSPAAAVRIAANAVTFGRAGHGFTLTGSGRNVGLGVTNVSDVIVAGNISTANAGGFGIFGSGNLASDNTAVRINGLGFDIGGTGHLIWGNASVSNGNGFDISGEGHVLTENVTSGDGVGFTIRGEGELIGNSAIGNLNAGVLLLSDASATVRLNNIFGNGERAEAPPLATRTNCGILNASGRKIDATRNFWGAASGPGEDPADEVCDVAGSQTITEPFAVRAFRIPKEEERFSEARAPR